MFINTGAPGPTPTANAPAPAAVASDPTVKATRRFEPQVPHELTNKALFIKISDAVNANRD